MKNIFNKEDNLEIINRINLLEPNATALWGKMSADQMLVHCNKAIEVARGEQDLKIGWGMRLLGKIMKKKAFSGPFRKNSPTAPEFIIKGNYNFEEEKKKLISNFKDFALLGKDAIKIEVHPFWGKMSTEDWNNLMYLHINHHLEQFNL
jgi:hypothetical protein